MKDKNSMLSMSKKLRQFAEFFYSSVGKINRSKAVFGLLLIFLAVQQSFAAPGDLDATFGTGGKSLINIGSGTVAGRAMVIQADGKIVVAGATDLNNSGSDFLVVRFNANGTLDTTFDGDGKVTTDFNGKSDAAFGVAMQADGKIVVAGTSGTNDSDGDFAVARYNSDGSLDSSFDGDGKVTTDFGTLNDEAAAVAIAPSGKIVVAGTTSSRNGDFAVASYLPDGSPDPVFRGGLVTTDAFCTSNCTNTYERVRGMGIDSNGRIIVAGDSKTTEQYATRKFAAVRYLDTGLLDYDFNRTRALLNVNSSYLTATGMALQADGKPVLIGSAPQASTVPPSGLAVARLTTSGFYDFGGIGVLPDSNGISYQPNSVSIQNDGKIVIAGNYGAQFLVVRSDSNGYSDSLFGRNGTVITDMDSTATGGGAYAVAVQPDGKIVAAGNQQSVSGGSIAVARYIANGCSSNFSSGVSSFNRIGGQRNISVNSPDGCQWNVISGATWLTVVSGGSGSGNGTVVIKAEPNYTTESRSTTLKVGSNVITVTQDRGLGIPKRVRFDMDNDGRSDIGVARIMDRQYLNFYSISSVRGVTQMAFYFANQQSTITPKIAPADYDGDGSMDYATWEIDSLNQGTFRVRYDYTFGAYNATTFGSLGDTPLPADWDGDGRADFAVYRSGTASNPQSYFYYRPSNSPGINFITVPWGTTGDKPVIGDFDGDGKNDAAVYRPSNGYWYILRSSDGGYSAIAFGISTDRPVPADYDGDGKTDIAVFRNGNWYLLQSTAGFKGMTFGNPTDVPVPGDYDGDGKTDIAVFRDGYWYLMQSTNGFSGTLFGIGTDTPLQAAYLQ